MPETLTVPLPRPTSSMRPPSPWLDAARITPEVLITPSSARAAPPAVMSTRPPPASISPLFAAPPEPSPATAMRTMPSPARSMVVRSPEASATVPLRATMTPAFSTSPPTSAASPASPMVSSPRLTTRAPGRSPPPMRSRPSAWKRAASTTWLEATSPPTSTRALSVKSTPAVFCTITVPGAEIAPSMTLARALSTRFKVAAFRPGWSKTTRWSRPTSKPCQSITARREVWVMVERAAVCAIRAAPLTTMPPCGDCASAAPAASASAEAPSSASARTLRRGAASLGCGSGTVMRYCSRYTSTYAGINAKLSENQPDLPRGIRRGRRFRSIDQKVQVFARRYRKVLLWVFR